MLVNGHQAATVEGTPEEEEVGSQGSITSRIQGIALPAPAFYCPIWFSWHMITLNGPFMIYYNIHIMLSITLKIHIITVYLS